MGLGRCHFTSAIAVDCGGNPEWKARAQARREGCSLQPVG